ncbi:metal-dependent hydrolase [Panacagrimonas sp.]|uniref:metal-dependent hydrolase n=1 Tax=Panacagrimonas sp. TaxID=2480088 RepID=UPI003B515B7B
MDGSSPFESRIVPRQGPNFGLDGDIPRYWFGGDAFKTRFFDAMSLLFPEGEKFFIQCVRDFRDRIGDPELQAQVKDFTYQEGQHGMVHNAYNERIARQGVAVDKIVAQEKRILSWFRRNLPKEYTIAHTAAVEHATAIMAHGFMNNPEVFAAADERMRALYVWHGVEEIEHKGVAFDVMQKVADVGYGPRTLAMLYVSVMFPLHTFLIMRHMFEVDDVPNRARTWAKGLWWLYGRRGLMTRLLPHYLAYYRPGFHPWKAGDTQAYARWREVFDSTGGDAIAASNALLPA